MSTLPDLQPGDVLLYRPANIYGWLIRLKTWHSISHVELYLGNGWSSASRDGLGVGLYPLRTAQLAVVMRPRSPIDACKAWSYTRDHAGTPYGWLELLNFLGIPVRGRGIVCSGWVTALLRYLDVKVFNNDPMDAIAPFQFLDSELLWEAWKDTP